MQFRGIFFLGGIVSLILIGAGCSSAPTAEPNQNLPVTESPATAAPNGQAGSAAILSAVATNPNSDVRIIGFSFQPPAITIKVNSTVTWSNGEQAPHTVTADDGSFDSKTLSPYGGSFKHLFSKPGTYTYHCSIHPTMHGTVTVTQ